MREIVDSLPDEATTIRSPGLTLPEATVPENPRKSRFGRLTHCTGKRNGLSSSALLDVQALEMLEQRGAVVPAHAV